MRLREKGWWWYGTWPFAHDNYTCIGKTVYHPKGRIPSPTTMRHENIHMHQQENVGLFKFLFLYLFCLPVVWNPWRFRWEYEAYTEGSGCSHQLTKRILRSASYGWLRNSK